MAKNISNSFTESIDYITVKALKRAQRWAASAQGLKVFLDAIGISNDYNPRGSLAVASGANTLTVTPQADHANSDYWWISVTDGKGHEAHGEVADLATPGTAVLSTVNFDYQAQWFVTIRARKTGDTQDAVIFWTIDNPSEDPTVVIPAGYNN